MKFDLLQMKEIGTHSDVVNIRQFLATLWVSTYIHDVVKVFVETGHI